MANVGEALGGDLGAVLLLQDGAQVAFDRGVAGSGQAQFLQDAADLAFGGGLDDAGDDQLPEEAVADRVKAQLLVVCTRPGPSRCGLCWRVGAGSCLWPVCVWRRPSVRGSGCRPRSSVSWSGAISVRARSSSTPSSASVWADPRCLRMCCLPWE